MRAALTREIRADVFALGAGTLLVAVAVGQYLRGVYGGATTAGIGAVLSFSFAVLLN